MKKLFTSVLLFFVCFRVRAQDENVAIFDFDNSDTFYHYWVTYTPLIMGDQLVINTVNYRHNQWQIGKPSKKIFTTAYTYPNAIVTDMLLPCLPNDTSVFILKLPYATLPYAWPLEWISFKYMLDIDSGDVAMIEGSVDSGVSWINILKDSTHTWVLTDTPNLSASTPQWDSALFSPAVFMPYDTVYLRFTLITGNDTTPRDGWMIDHIIAKHTVEAVTSIKERTVFQLYPDPAVIEAKLKFTKPLKTDCQIIASDAIGRQVYQHQLNKGSTDYTLSVQDWVKGIYFIELDDEKGSRMVRKLMVE